MKKSQQGSLFSYFKPVNKGDKGESSRPDDGLAQRSVGRGHIIPSFVMRVDLLVFADIGEEGSYEVSSGGKETIEETKAVQ